MKRLLFFLIALIFAVQGWTQGEISVGANGTGTALVPINHFYNYNYSQMLYEQSSLTAGTITAIKFKYSAATGYTVNPVVVYMKTTTKSSFSSTSDFDSIGLTQVFSGSVTSATGWVTITLTTPYVYDGTGNLLIAVDNNYADYDGSSTSYWNNLPTADNKTINAYSDTYNPDPLNPNGNASTKTVGQYIPSLTVVITPTDPTFCFPPTNLASSNIVVDGAQLTWNSDVNVTSYSIEYKTRAQTWAEATIIPGITDTTYTLTNLTSNTLYDVKVIPTCSSSLPSTITFRTACGTISSLPYSESFDTYGTGSGIFLTCWGRITSTPTTYPYIATTNSSAPGSMYMYTASGAYNYIATPEFDASIPINTLTAFFKLYKGSAAYNITVGVMSDPNDTTTFDSITNLSPTSTSTWQTFGVNFTNYTGTGQYIAFKVQGFGATNAMYIDDLEIDISPVCSIPTGLTDYDSLATPNSMELDWDGADDANVLSWIVEYKPIDSTTWQSTQAFSHPFSLTGLQSGTVYQIRLYAICSSGDTTYSTPTINVGLPCEVITTIPWYEGFENVWFVAAGLNTGTHPWCWTNINGGASATYLWRKTTTSSYIHSGSGALQMYAANTTGQLGDWFISPTISLAGNQRLRFWAKGYSTYTDNLTVKILDLTTNPTVSSASDTSLFVELMPNTVIPASDWTEYEINLSDFIGDYRFAFVRNTTGGYYLNIDDVSITELPNCARPTAINTGYVIDEEIELSWIPGNTGDAAWYLYWKTASATDYDSVYVTQQPYVLQNLTANTTYNIYLRTDCLTELSEATNPISIKTALCAPVTTFPYTEGFDSLGAAGAFPPCWARPVIYSTYPKTSTAAARVHSAPASLEIHSAVGSPTYAVTPPMGEDINTLRVTFWAMAENTTSSGTIEVGVMSDPNNLLTFESVQVIQPTNTSYNQYEVIFAGTTLNGLNKSIAFRQNTASSVYYYWIDDIVVDYIPACSKPASVEVSNITTTNADITWAPANATDAAWWLYYKTGAATEYDSVYVTTTPSHSFTTLSTNTLYNIYIVTDCGDQLSEPSDVYSFRTPCVPITSLPLTESFDYYGTSAGTFPPCWARPVLNTTTPYPSIVTAYSTSSPASLRFQSASATAPTYAITPQIDFDINTLKVKFMLKAENTTSSGTMEVGVMSDPAVLSSFELVTTIQPTSTNFTEYEVLFNNTTLTGAGNHIAFKHVTVSSAYYYWLDDVVVDIIPSCPHPDSLYAANVTQTDADIYFTPSDLADAQWKLYYRQAGTSSWTDVDIFAIPYQMTGLTANTAYEVYVKTLCSDATYSDASSILSFRTPCDNVLTIPYTENFDTYGTGTAATSYPTCWSRNVTTYATANYPYISTTNYSTPGAMYFYAYNNTRTVAVCHPIDATIPINTLMVEFKMRYSTLDTNGIQVGVMTDPNDFSTFVPVGPRQTISEVNVWEDKAVLLNSYTGIGQYIALVADAPASQYARAYVDDFVVDYIPSCPNVYGLSIGASSTTSVYVNWDNTDDQGSGYNIAYATNLIAPFDPTTATIIPVSTGTTLPYIIPGFTPGDSVWVAIQRGCNGAFTDAKKVTLPTFANILPFTCDFEDTNVNNTLTIINETQTNKWFIGAAGANGTGNGLYVSSDNGATASYADTTSVTMVSTLVELGNYPEFALTFDWKAGGEGTTTLYDYIAVYVLPVGEPVVAGTLPSETYRVSPKLNLQSTWQTEMISLGLAYSNTIQKIVFAWRNDSGGGIQPGGMIDNINIVGVNCPSTTNLATSNITTNSADISWSSNLSSVTDWWIYWKEATATDWVDSLNISQNPYTLSNLLPNTPYQVRIINNCGTELSLPINIMSFRTACDNISILPYSENFEGYGTGTSIMPACWVRTTTYADRPYVNTGGYSGNCLYFYAGTAGTYNIAAMNPIDVSIPINSLMATFYYKNSSSTDRLIVGVMTDPTNATTFDSITTIAAPTTATWAEYEVNFSSYTGTGTYIAFKNIYTTTNGYGYVDNLVIDYTPACGIPSAISGTSLPTSIDVTITPFTSSDTEWEVFYRVVNTSDWDSINALLTTVTIPNLQPQTEYEIYVKTVCSDGSYSNATSSIIVPTQQFPEQIPYTCDFETPGNNGWLLKNGSCTNRWMIGTPTGGTSNALFVSNNNADASYTLTSFSAVVAEKLFEFNTTDSIQISFDLTIGGESSFDYLKVFLVDKDTVFNPATAAIYYAVNSYAPGIIMQNGSNNYINLLAGTQTLSKTIASPGIGQQRKLVFVWKNDGSVGNGNSPIIDNINITTSNPNPCAPPTNLSVSNIQNTTATISWIPAGTESAWQVRLGATGTPVDVSSTTYTFPTTLTPGTAYTYFVRANCGTNYSAWVQGNFTTTQGHQAVQVTTIAPTAITQTNATFQGTYVQGTEVPTSIGFEYKTTSATTWTDQPVTPIASPFTYQVTTLTANTSYKVRAYVVTATDGRVFGDTITFTTLAIIPPTVTTDSVRNVSQTSATFYGTITANTEQIEARGFEYKLSTEAWADAIIISATGVTNIYASPTTLQDGRTYNVRAYGRTLSDTSYGQTLTFSTLTAPTVTTTPTQPADVQSTSATLKGTVTSAGNALPSQVVVGFVYSTTTNPVIGATGVLQAEATYSTTDPNFTTQITQLVANTNYFVKAYITNPVTTAYGNEANFITLGLLGVDGKEISIMMYPNPATSQTNLIVEGVSGETKIVLSDVQGRILNTINTKAVNGVVEQTIDLNNLAKGVYYIRIQNSYINRTQKLIVK